MQGDHFLWGLPLYNAIYKPLKSELSLFRQKTLKLCSNMESIEQGFGNKALSINPVNSANKHWKNKY